MSYCSNCGEEVSADATFCEGCGTEIGSGTDDTEAPAVTGENGESGIDEAPDEGIDWGHIGAATGIALLPAFGAYMMLSLAANGTVGIAFILALPVFAYLLYQRPTAKTMLGGMCFWLAVEAFLSPVVMLIYTAMFASQETSSAAGEAGAAIGGTFLMIIAFVVGIPVGIALYLVSRRLDVAESDGTAGSVQTAG